MKKFDILIVGAGMVGLTLALALRKTTRLTIAIADTTPITDLPNEPTLRVSAINMASKHIFSKLDVWPDICAQRLQDYQHMHVWDKAGYGKLSFSTADIVNAHFTQEKIEQLGWIIENNVIRHALWNKAQQDEGITFYTDEKITNLGVGDNEVFASFTTQTPITAKLIVGADGANSWVRKQMDMSLIFRDYDHHAIVGTVKCEHGHQNTAWQVFLPTGPLAFLPLSNAQSDSKLCSIVWSTSPEEAERLKALSQEEFSKELTAASDGKLGNITLCSETVSYPLAMRMSQSFTQNRVALVGDAAHTIHPLAGQGVNLGLLDAASLAQLLTEQIEKQKNTSQTEQALWANSTVLNQYARWRKSEAAEMVAAMESIKQVFTPQNPVAQLVRGIGMTLFDNVQPIKQQMVKQALGLKSNLPALAIMKK